MKASIWVKEKEKKKKKEEEKKEEKGRVNSEIQTLTWNEEEEDINETNCRKNRSGGREKGETPK